MDRKEISRFFFRHNFFKTGRLFGLTWNHLFPEDTLIGMKLAAVGAGAVNLKLTPPAPRAVGGVPSWHWAVRMHCYKTYFMWIISENKEIVKHFVVMQGRIRFFDSQPNAMLEIWLTGRFGHPPFTLLSLSFRGRGESEFCGINYIVLTDW